MFDDINQEALDVGLCYALWSEIAERWLLEKRGLKNHEDQKPYIGRGKAPKYVEVPWVPLRGVLQWHQHPGSRVWCVALGQLEM